MRQQMGLRDEQKKMRECSLARGDRESVASSLSTPARDATPGYDRAHASNGGRGRLRPPAWCGRQAFQGHPHEYQVLGAWRREGIRLRWFFAVLLGSSWVCFTCPAGAWRNSLSYCTGIASGPCWCMSVCNRLYLRQYLLDQWVFLPRLLGSGLLRLCHCLSSLSRSP
jgi:hypothetical protein